MRADLQPPHLAAREVSHLAAGAIRQANAREHLAAAQACFAPVNACRAA